MAKPLHWLTEKASEFQWSDQCAEAFRKLKQRLPQAPILAFPDFTKTFVLDTDASNDGIGAVLSKKNDGRETVVAHASRVLSKAKELLRHKERAAGCRDTPSALPPIHPRTPLRSTDRPWIPHLATQF